MAPVLKLAAEKHPTVVGINVGEIVKASRGDRLASDFKAVQPLLKAQFATLTVDFDGQIQADARLTFAKESDAKEGAAGLNDSLDLARGGLEEMLKQLDKAGDSPQQTALLKNVRAALRDVKATQKGSMVEMEAALKPDLQTAIGAQTEVIDSAKKDIETTWLRELAFAMHKYHDAYGHFPAAAVYDKDGKPLLSWRVLLLPYLDQKELYNQFHLDEPWDSDNNKKLLEKMPTVFSVINDEAQKKHETYFQAFVGKGSVFEGKTGLTMPKIAAADGTSLTILFAEAKKPVPWTKPEDIVFDEGELVPKVGGLSKGGFMAAMCDGSVRFLPASIKEETLRALVTWNGGETIPDLNK